MAETELRHSGETADFVPESGVTAGDLLQLKDGRAGYALEDITSGVLGVLRVVGTVRIPKTAGLNFLDGGDVYWDYSANKAHYKPVDDRDFFIGTAVGDWANSSTLVEVALNNPGRYLVDLARDGFRTSITGTQGLNTMGIFRRGGLHNVIVSATSEAQKIDALSVPGFTTTANAIVEAVFAVSSDGAGTVVDVSIGVASATHATDADSIAEHLFCHLDANNTAIRFQSKDGSTTVASTDSTITYTEGSAVANLVYVWFDMRAPADVQIYVNGSLVLGASVFNVTAAVGPWKLLLHVEKTSSTDTYELDLHSLRARIGEI